MHDQLYVFAHMESRLITGKGMTLIADFTLVLEDLVPAWSHSSILGVTDLCLHKSLTFVRMCRWLSVFHILHMANEDTLGLN